MAQLQPAVDFVGAIVKGTTWQTAVDCDVAGSRLLLDGENIRMNIDEIEDVSLNNQNTRGKSYRGRVTVGGTIQGKLDVQNNALLYGLFFGTPAAAQVGATTAYDHTYTKLDVCDGLFATYCQEKNYDLEEYPSVKVTEYHLTGVAGQPWMTQWNLKADNRKWDNATVDSADATSTNSGLTSATLSNTDIDNCRLFFNTAARNVFWLNWDSSGLGAGDVIYPSAFEFHCVRTYPEIFTSQHAPYSSEMKESGFMSWTGSFTLPCAETSLYQEYAKNKTTGKLSLVISAADDAIESGYTFSHGLYIPQLQIVEAPAEAAGPELTEVQVQFWGSEATANPTGMSDMTPYVVNRNERSSAIF